MLRWLGCAFLSFIATAVRAHSCVEPESVKSAWQRSPYVFLGRVLSDERGPHFQAMLRVEVLEAFKGVRVGQVVSLAHDWTMTSFHPGTTRLVYGGAGLEMCGRTMHKGTFADDLLFLRALPGSARGTRLSGTLVDFYGGHRFKGVRVTLHGPAQLRREVWTNSDGVFEVYSLPPGEYRVTPDAGEKWRLFATTASARFHPEPHTKLMLHPEEDVNMAFFYEGPPMLSGRVRDAAGQPFGRSREITVRLVPLGGGARTLPAYTGIDAGEFDYRQTPNGRYQLRVQAGDVEDYVYPQTLDLATGRTVALGDIRVPFSNHRVRVDATVVDHLGRPAARATLRFKSRAITFSPPSNKGRFSFEILAGRPGQLSAGSYACDGRVESLADAVTIPADRPLTQLVLILPAPPPCPDRR